MEKRFDACKHCGRDLVDDKNPDGFSHKITNGAAMHLISCPCGVMTKLCVTLEDLEIVWNSTPTKRLIKTTISVKHPGTRGLEPDTIEGQQASNLQKAKTHLNPEMFAGDPF